jgi:hypothetical protein
LTAIRSAWKTRFAGWPSPNRAGVGIASSAHDRPCDLPRVALLAVAAEDQRELALVGLVDELARRELRRRVHPHVERRVGGIREPALGPVELHRGDTEIEEDRVGLDVVRRQLPEDERELAAQQPRRHARRSLEPIEVRAHGGIAVDRDQLPLRAEVGGEQAGVAAGAEGRVDDGLARAHREELAHLVGEDGDVVRRACLQDVRQHRLRSLRPS